MTVIVKCKRDAGDIEGEAITDPLIVTDNMAVRRGRRFLDDPSLGGYYSVNNTTIETVHKGNHIVPGVWVGITDSRLRHDGTPMKVTSMNLSIRPNKVSASLGLEEYCPPELMGIGRDRDVTDILTFIDRDDDTQFVDRDDDTQFVDRDSG